MNAPLETVLIACAAFGVCQRGLPAQPTPANSASVTSVITSTVPPEMRLSALPTRAPDPSDNPSSPQKIALGRLLFFDPILSATLTVSCATCHHPRFGWADGRPIPIGVGGHGLGPERTFASGASVASLTRNSPTILNAGFNGLVTSAKLDPSTSPMFWDSRVRSLEQQVVAPIQSREEMRGDTCADSEAVAAAIARVQAIGEYRDRFAAAFDKPSATAVTSGNLAQAIAAFERSLTTPPTTFDRFLQGDPQAMNSQQQRGMHVFESAGCIQCHGGPMFSDFKLHVIGSLNGAAAEQREFRTPSLRNLRHTAPYMHDGSLQTLEDVFVFYDQLAEKVSETLDGGDTTAHLPLDPLLRPINLNPDDFPALKAFLDTLSSDSYDKTIPTAVPSGLPVIQ